MSKEGCLNRIAKYKAHRAGSQVKMKYMDDKIKREEDFYAEFYGSSDKSKPVSKKE